MIKVLYIDPVSHLTHASFNKMQLQALMNNSDVFCVFKQGYSSYLNLSTSNIVLEIPLKYYDFQPNGLVTRLQYWRILTYIKRHVDFSLYDRVIYSYYEEISFFFAGMPKGALLINHVNLAGLSSYIKRWFYKQVSKSNTQLVFNERMKAFLTSIGINSVKIVAHGIPSKFNNSNNSVFDELNINIIAYKKILFMPSATSANQSFLRDLLSSKDFNDYLKNKKYLLIVKGDYPCRDESNILILKHYLSDECYKSLLLQSDIVLLSYHEKFINRVSGILFECIGNEKNVVLSNVDGLLAYKAIFAWDPYFTDIDSLMYKIDCYDYYDSVYRKDIDRKELEPNYERLLSHS